MLICRPLLLLFCFWIALKGVVTQTSTGVWCFASLWCHVAAIWNLLWEKISSLKLIENFTDHNWLKHSHLSKDNLTLFLKKRKYIYICLCTCINIINWQAAVFSFSSKHYHRTISHRKIAKWAFEDQEAFLYCECNAGILIPEKDWW